MLKRILSIYSSHKKNVAIQLLIIFTIQGMAMLSPYVFGKIADDILQKKAMNHIVLLASSMLLVDVVWYFLARLRQHVSINHIWFPIQEKLRFQTLQRYFNFSIGQHKNNHSGINGQITTQGEQALQSFANLMVTFYVPTFVRVLITSVVLLWLHLPIGIVVTVGLLCYALGQLKMESKYRPMINKRRDLGNDSSNYRTDLMRGAVLIQSYQKKTWAQDKYRKRYHAQVVVAKQVSRYTSTWDGLLTLIVDVTACTALLVGVYLIYHNKLSLGQLVTARIWWQQACGMVSEIGNRYQDTQEELSQIRKFFDLVDTPPAIKEFEHDRIRLGGNIKEIEFRDVSFSYPSQKEGENKKKILDGISLTIKEGEKVAIVGPSGCGKTTLITLLQRGYDPDSGSILIGGGHYMYSLDLSDWYKHMSIVDQASLMIDGTIRENIELGAHGTISDEKILELCKIAELEMDEFSEGLDTEVGQDGKKLSGGQRQRIAIARAIASDPKLLVLDEATASLDGIAEARIQQALINASLGRTIIMIAHRISTVQRADRIFVMEHGKILSVGTHKELMTSCKLYQDLAMSQMIDVGIDERLLEQGE